MGDIYFEKDLVKVMEDKIVQSIEYDASDEMITETSNITIISSSNYYSYDDGWMLFLKVDNSSTDKLYHYMLAMRGFQALKKLATIPASADVTVNRYENNVFILRGSDYQNKEEFVLFESIGETGALATIRVACTKIVEYKILNKFHILINSYELLEDDKCIWTVCVYDYNGKVFETIYDEKETLQSEIKTQTKEAKNGDFTISVSKETDKGSKVVAETQINYQKEKD